MDNREYLMVKHSIAQAEKTAILETQLDVLCRCTMHMMGKLNMDFDTVCDVFELGDDERVAVLCVLESLFAE